MLETSAAHCYGFNFELVASMLTHTFIVCFSVQCDTVTCLLDERVPLFKQLFTQVRREVVRFFLSSLLYEARMMGLRLERSPNSQPLLLRRAAHSPSLPSQRCSSVYALYEWTRARSSTHAAEGDSPRAWTVFVPRSLQSSRNTRCAGVDFCNISTLLELFEAIEVFGVCARTKGAAFASCISPLILVLKLYPWQAYTRAMSFKEHLS